MAKSVPERALAEHRHLIVEAGTGTGKTLAYLLPALRTGRRVIISTGTKALQDQLYFRDIPFLEPSSAPSASATMKAAPTTYAATKLVVSAISNSLRLEEIDQYQQISKGKNH